MLSYNILGIRVDKADFNSTLKAVEGFIEENKPHLVITLGVEMIMRALRDKEFKNIVEKADLVTPDTVGILWASKKLGFNLKEKVSGIDLLYRLCGLSSEKSWGVYFLGAKPGIAELAVEKLKEKYPKLKVLGCHHGYFANSNEIIEKINQAAPEILFLALGSPKQEKWFWENKNNLKAKVAIGAGGSLDVISGKLKRAPRWMINLSLEWLYRLYKEPSRFKRMLAIPKFIWLVYKYSISSFVTRISPK